MKVASPPSAETIFKAFADPTRLRLLHMLRGGELCVCDIVDVLGLSQPKVSRHLAYLRRAGLVTARKDGYWAYYSLAKAGSALHRKLIECIDCCLGDVPAIQEDTRRLAKKKSCCS